MDRLQICKTEKAIEEAKRKEEREQFKAEQARARTQLGYVYPNTKAI